MSARFLHDFARFVQKSIFGLFVHDLTNRTKIVRKSCSLNFTDNQTVTKFNQSQLHDCTILPPSFLKGCHARAM